MGPIPPAIFQHEFTNLDLSFNKLNGEVASSMRVTNQSRVVLSINRLSGVLPRPLLNLQAVDVLESNVFSCSHTFDSSASALPANDRKATTYVCGSDNLSSAMLGYAICFSVSLALVMCVKWLSRPSSETSSACFSTLQKYSQDLFVRVREAWGVFSWDFWQNDALALRKGKGKGEREGEVTHANNEFNVNLSTINSSVTNTSIADVNKTTELSEDVVGFLLFGEVLSCLRRSCRLHSVMILMVLLPLYTVLHQYYSVYTHVYLWVTSVAFLSGAVPAIILLFVLCIYMLAVYCIFNMFVLSIHRDDIHVKKKEKSESEFLWTPDREPDPTRVIVGLDENTGNQDKNTTNNTMEKRPTRYDYLCLVLVFLINLAVSGGANSLYVYFFVQFGEDVSTFLQGILSIFKVL